MPGDDLASLETSSVLSGSMDSLATDVSNMSLNMSVDSNLDEKGATSPVTPAKRVKVCL